MAKIAAVVITKNEERNIGRCLKSLRTVADEILVVDSYSTDKTKAICESFPEVRFVQTQWKGYSSTKNYANGMVEADYILSVDADEELSSDLNAEIQRLKNKLSGDEAYYLNRITNYCGKWIHHSGWLPDYQLRLYPKKKAKWNGAAVHEQVEFIENVKTKKLKGFLNHYSYYTLNEHLDRAKIYTSLGAQKVLEKNEKFLMAKAIVNPFLRFLRTFFIKRGFMDGFYGFGLSVFSSFTVFLKYFKAWQAKKYNTEP